MDMFIVIHSRLDDCDFTVDTTTIMTYESKDVIDPDDSVHKCIVYTLTNGVIIQEEFSSDSDRDSRLELLDTYNL